MIKDIRRKLLGFGLAASLGKRNLGELDLNNGKEMLKRATDLIEKGILGYTLIAARKTQVVTEGGGEYDCGINR
ncbi:MAG: hypothetical protein Q8Q07_01900 [Dehalococcoidales bacterium]|nr:hypothetical protein [Dehalococcoidales bacterium]